MQKAIPILQLFPVNKYNCAKVTVNDWSYQLLL